MAIHLATGLAKEGFAIDIVLMRKRTPDFEPLELPGTVNVISLEADRGLQAIPALARYLRSCEPLALMAISTPLCVSAFAGNLLSRRKVPCICRQVSTFSKMFAGYKGYNRWLTPWIARPVLRRSHVIAISRGVAEDLIQNVGVDRSRIRVLYNPTIAPDFLGRLEEDVKLPELEVAQGPTVVAVGRLVAAKGFDVLIRALALVRTTVAANLVILGEGPERANLEALIKSLGLENSVRLPGYQRNTLPIVKRADVFAMSSRWEGFGNVLVEALYTGVPVVATDCPHGPREILDGGRFGTLVPVDDPVAMAAGIRRALNGEEQIDRDARDEWLGQFTVENAVKEFVRYLEHVVK